MTDKSRLLFFSPSAQLDIELELDYLREHAGESVAIHYVHSVNRTAELLRTTPYIGMSCGFRQARFRDVRRFPIHASFQKRLLFYTSDPASLRVERILHGARNWAVLFR